MTQISRPHPARALVVTLVTIAGFLIADHDPWILLRLVTDDREGPVYLTALIVARYFIPYGLLPFLVVSLFVGPRQAPSVLGLTRSPLTGIVFGLIGTAPMLIALALTHEWAPGEALMRRVLQYAVLPGFFEEILFRAFLFGVLFRLAGWGFLPAAALGGVLFGAAHLAQSGDPMDAAAIAALTGTGAVWFSWLYTEWRFNIWVPVAFHVSMNLYWELFDASDTALGDAASNGARLGVIVLSIILTLAWKRRRDDRRLAKGRAWLWGGPQRVSASAQAA